MTQWIITTATLKITFLSRKPDSCVFQLKNIWNPWSNVTDIRAYCFPHCTALLLSWPKAMRWHNHRAHSTSEVQRWPLQASVHTEYFFLTAKYGFLFLRVFYEIQKITKRCLIFSSLRPRYYQHHPMREWKKIKTLMYIESLCYSTTDFVSSLDYM